MMDQKVDRVTKAITEAFEREGRVFDEGQAETLARAAIEAMDAPIGEIVGIVMKNSGGSANPVTVETVIRALRGERVSFVGTPTLPTKTSS